MIVSKIICEKIVQVEDPFRIKVEALGEFTKLEIKPEDSAAYFDVTDYQFLDWQYLANGNKTISIRFNEDDLTIKTVDVKCLTEAEDRLFSDDDSIVSLEEDIHQLLRSGKLSFINKHRQSQTRIIEKLNERGIRNSEGNEITKENIAITKELNAWSRYLTLHLVYFDRMNEVDGIFANKAEHYLNLARAASKDRQFVTIDPDGDGVLEAEKTQSNDLNGFSFSGSLERK